MPRVLWKLLVLLTFMFGAVVALLWILVEAVGAVTDGSDWIWYLAFGFTVVPLILFAIAAARWRTRVAVVLTTCAALLVCGVALTYPNDPPACTPVADQGGSTSGGGGVSGLEDGALLEDEDVDSGSGSGSQSTDCK